MHHAAVERLNDWAAPEVRIVAAAVIAARGLAEDDALRDAIVVDIPFPLQVDPVEGPDIEGRVLEAGLAAAVPAAQRRRVRKVGVTVVVVGA